MTLNRARLTLVLIFFLFATPVVVAVLMHSPWWNYQPGGMTNLGTLVQPPQPLDYQLVETNQEAGALDRWVILYPVVNPCIERCLKDIESLRQIHRASGRHQEQLSVMPLIPTPSDATAAAGLLKTYPAFVLGYDRTGAIEAVLRRLGDLQPDGTLQPGQVFLVDPAGNIMMRYAAGFDPNHLNKDLKRLLKLSGTDG